MIGLPLTPKVRLVVLSLVVGCSAVSGYSQIAGGMNETTNVRLGGNNYIVGTVYWPSGKPASTRVGIRLGTPLNGDVMSMTDDTGKFVFSGLPSGTYTLNIDRAKDFEPVSQTVSINRPRSSGSETYILNIRLVDKARKDSKPGVVDAKNADVPKSAMKLYAKAMELVAKEDRKRAIEQLVNAIREYPAFASAYNEIGVQYMRLGDLYKADLALTKALKINPDAYEAQVNRGIVLFRLNRLAESDVALREAIKVKASSVCHFYLGRSLAQQKRYDEAEAEFKAVVGLGDEFKEVHRLLAIIYLDRGDKARLIQELETYLRLVPTAADADDLRKLIKQSRAAETRKT